MSDFLSSLSDQILNQFNATENKNKSLDVMENGHARRFGKLGDFAKKIDTSEERRYVEQGYLRFDAFNAKPKAVEILMQEPEITILVKKRAFSTLSENFNTDLMDKDEKLFLKATKILFQNKCNQIAALEKLAKIDKIGKEIGTLPDKMMPMIISLVDGIAEVNSVGSASNLSTFSDGSVDKTRGLSKLQNTIKQIRNVYAYSDNKHYTTWLADTTNPFTSQYGKGTGVIELTNVSSIRTGVGVDFGSGGGSITIDDPYGLMRITSDDIEKALSDANNSTYDRQIFQLGKSSLEENTNAAINKLNSIRNSRGVSNIQFITNPDTLLGKKVRAIIEKTGSEIIFEYDAAASLNVFSQSSNEAFTKNGVTIAPDFVLGTELPEIGQEALDNVQAKLNKPRLNAKVSESETNLFIDVIVKLYENIQLQQNARAVVIKSNKQTNYARKKLRQHYLGMLAIQPMDQIHIYVSSKAKVDDNISYGFKNMYSGLGGAIAGLKNQISQNNLGVLFGGDKNAIEKSVIVGEDFPNWLWFMMRPYFVGEPAGTHIFGGVVDHSGGDYAAGKYSVNVYFKDNTHYFSFGTVNIQPSLNVFNGSLMEPLTQFKQTSDSISFVKDSFPDLLDENVALLKEGFAKAKDGPSIGKVITEKNYGKTTEVNGNDANIKKVYYSPDGFVYRWKEGVATLAGLSSGTNILGEVETQGGATYINPFAGQDVMNIMSLMIVGVPYNYSTFYKAAIANNGGLKDKSSYYSFITPKLNENNKLWGNFIPFKDLTMSEETFKALSSYQISINENNTKIDNLLSNIKDQELKLAMISRQPLADAKGKNETIESLQKNIAINKQKLNSLISKTTSDLEGSKYYGNLKVFGDDITLDFEGIPNGSSLTKTNVRKEIRKKLNFLTKRLSWKVRANEDQNLLIIDDSYDKDYDFTAFESKLIDTDNFNSQYTTVESKIKDVKELLKLEVFCDTQGHIRIRPPQYNKIPSSIFNKLLKMHQSSGIKLLPDFIETISTNQVQESISQIEILEDQIRIDASLLGKVDDKDIVDFINSGSKGVYNKFEFLSNENGDIVKFEKIANDDPAVERKELNKIISTTKTILNTQANASFLFSASQRASAVSETLNDRVFFYKTSNDRVNDINNRLYLKTRQKYNPVTDVTIVKSAQTYADPIKITKGISDKISERQRLIKKAANALKNIEDYANLDNNTGDYKMLAKPSNESKIPEVFESLIEDESYDDYGHGSGNRFIIKDSQIISLSHGEEAPAFTMVQVNGMINTFVPNNQLGGINADFAPGQSGNSQTTAAAIDYDLYRRYGFRNTQAITLPFFTDPELQCAPYAASILNNAREGILKASVTIVGNEYMQPGDVVYVESLGLLYYVNKVDHSFTYGSRFTTTLSLTFGHAPGEYIPTALDMIGKLLYNNRSNSNSVNYRQGNNNEKPAGAIIIDSSDLSKIYAGSIDPIFSGSHGDANIKAINKIISLAEYAFYVNNDPNSNMVAKVEVRYFFNPFGGLADVIKMAIEGKITFDGKSVITNKPLSVPTEGYVNTVFVDLNKLDEAKAPSQQAVSLARDLQALKSGINNKKIKDVISYNIIDCWITFTHI